VKNPKKLAENRMTKQEFIAYLGLVAIQPELKRLHACYVTKTSLDTPGPKALRKIAKVLGLVGLIHL
jgi:hypothetical protein